MPYPVVFAAIAIGGVAILGLGIYNIIQEQRSYNQYQENHNYYQRQGHQNNDFEFDQEFMEEDDKEQNSHQLRHHATQLRSRRPFSKSNASSFNQDQFELAELENSIAERKKRLMAEQAFLDKKEENLRFRRMELTREEHQKSSYQAAASSPNEEISSSRTPSIQLLDPFANNDINDDSDDDGYCGTHEKHNSSDGENTAILINNQKEESDAEISSNSSDYESEDHHNMSSSSNLQFPDASQIIVADLEATASMKSSRSEMSWDSVSEEWSPQSDSDEYEHS